MSCSDDPTCREFLDHLIELVDAEAPGADAVPGSAQDPSGTRAQRRPGGDDATTEVPGGDDWADAGVDARTRTLLAQHAAGCAHCHDALDAERHVRTLLRRCCTEEDRAPEALRARILSVTTTIRGD